MGGVKYLLCKLHLWHVMDVGDGSTRRCRYCDYEEEWWNDEGFVGWQPKHMGALYYAPRVLFALFVIAVPAWWLLGGRSLGLTALQFYVAILGAWLLGCAFTVVFAYAVLGIVSAVARVYDAAVRWRTEG